MVELLPNSSDGGRTVHGKVTAVLVSVDAATRRVPVEAELQNDGDRPILAGTFVRGSIRGDEKVRVLRLPASIIRPGSQDEVMVIERDAGGKDARLHVRRVHFVGGTEGTILVRSGLQPTDEVLRSPTAESREGDTVVIAQAPGGAR
jgi:multidrug efflux pump subunit AcrA (membrane-fusion protein)